MPTPWNHDVMQRVEVTRGGAVIMKAVAVAVAVTFFLAGTGCAGNGGAETSRDCQTQVRADGIVYTSYGYTERSATTFSLADQAECEDVGEDAAGSVFPQHPRQVTTWAFPGYPPEDVLGVRFDQDSFVVYVADSVPDQERDRIYEDLASAAGEGAPAPGPGRGLAPTSAGPRSTVAMSGAVPVAVAASRTSLAA